MKTDERPGIGGAATEVTVAMHVMDILGVDDVNQQLEIDFFAILTWIDPRLKEQEGCRFVTTEVWFPRLQFLNSSKLSLAFRNARQQVAVGPGGKVTFVQRFTGSISSYHNLLRFPFDSHDFKIEIGAINAPHAEVAFLPNHKDTWISERLNIEGWTFGDVWLETESEFVRQANRELSIVSLNIPGSRDAEFFVYRFLLLLTFVVGMSWVVFWVPPRNFEFQIGIGATSMLTAIAFNITVANQLPPLGYLTVLDRMVIWATLLIFLSIVEALVTGRLVLADREDLAFKVDLWCRFIFPALLFSGWLILALG